MTVTNAPSASTGNTAIPERSSASRNTVVSVQRSSTDLSMTLSSRLHVNRFGRALAPFRDDEDVEEVHRAEHEQHEADLRAQEFDGFLRRDRLVAELQRERHVAHVDQVKADDEQVIDGVGEP